MIGSLQGLWPTNSFLHHIIVSLHFLHLPFNISSEILSGVQVMNVTICLSKTLFSQISHRGSVTSFISVCLASSLIPGVMVIVTATSLGTRAYIGLLTPADIWSSEDSEELIMVSLPALLTPLIMHVIFISALFVNIYFFSRKIFQMAAYKRIL